MGALALQPRRREPNRGDMVLAAALSDDAYSQLFASQGSLLYRQNHRQSGALPCAVQFQARK